MKIMKRDSFYLCNIIGNQRTKGSFHRGFPCSHHSKPLLNNMSMKMNNNELISLKKRMMMDEN
jgi:hypothetical protein